MENTLKKKEKILENTLKRFERVLVAFSGGVDSTFLLAEAVRVLGRDNTAAVTSAGKTIPKKELDGAVSSARKLGVEHIIVKTDELKIPGFALNGKDRCFRCKRALFKSFIVIAKRKNMVLCEGSNLSDLSDYRPGMKAVRELGVKSPLLDAKISKDEIRRLSKRLRLKAWDRPAQACLSSRFPYGAKITYGALKKVEKSEDYLKELGFKTLRVRCHGDSARIELARQDIKKIIQKPYFEKVSAQFRKLGWKHISVDIDGYRTGSMN